MLHRSSSTIAPFCGALVIVGVLMLVGFIPKPALAQSTITIGSQVSAVTPKPTLIPIVEPNVYVRETFGPNGMISIMSFQYAGDGMWDDCGNCADVLELTAVAGDFVYYGPAAERFANAAYSLALKPDQIVQKGAYHYRTFKGNRRAKTNNRWSGKGRLLRRRGGSYVSQIFFAYYDPNVVMAEKGLCDPTMRTCPKR